MDRVMEIKLGKYKVIVDKDVVLPSKGWCLSDDKGYLVHRKYQKRLNGKDVYKKTHLHHFIIGKPPRGLVVDHINGDVRDNRRKNLRFCTQSQNIFNGKKRKNNTSGLIGVRQVKGTGKWEAYINKNFKKIHLGSFDTKDEAVKARKNGEIKYFPDFKYGNMSINTS